MITTKKQLCDIPAAGRFMYAGIDWVKLDTDPKTGNVLALSVGPIFNRAFDDDNCNDWRASSLRRELNGPFLDALVAEGADREAFAEFESDLTADDGMKDYGTATDRLALLTDDLYRRYRAIIPPVDTWCWNLTPYSCQPDYRAYARDVNSSGTLNYDSACRGSDGVRPLCNFKSGILVSVIDEEATAEEARQDTIGEAADAILQTLDEFDPEIRGDAMAAALARMFAEVIDAQKSRTNDTGAAEG